MKIRYTEDGGCPFGQFVVNAENPSEERILAQFLQGNTGNKWRFWLHGFSRELDSEGNDSFNFGWVKEKYAPQPAEDCFAARCALVINKPKPKMLFLDDRRKRIESARAKYGDKFALTVVSNVKECLRAMSEEDWEEVHLDHDLNGDDFQDPDDPTAGMEVVRYIVKTGWPPNKRKPIFRVHSSNIFASWFMVRTLQEAGHIAVWERFEYREGISCAS